MRGAGDHRTHAGARRRPGHTTGCVHYIQTQTNQRSLCPVTRPAAACLVEKEIEDVDTGLCGVAGLREEDPEDTDTGLHV